MPKPKIDLTDEIKALKTKANPNRITLERAYRLITPMFGGGVTPKERDPLTPIRGSSVRGQLRFWWRATRAGQFGGDLRAMKDAEDKIWGAAALPSDNNNKPIIQPIQLAITINRHGQVAKLHTLPAYVAFPLRSTKQDPKNYDAWKGIEFTLTLTVDQTYLPELEAALWAWETFGGVGGRTRRGFGAIQCTAMKKNGLPVPLAKLGNDPVKQIRLAAQHHIAQGVAHHDLPVLSSALPNLEATPLCPNAEDAWEKLINKLKIFRQARRPGADNRKPGRSYWPEPDEIRRKLKTAFPHKHKNPVSHINKFPRAAFGLPIIFHFKDGAGDPEDTTLQGVAHDRFASPLILRPIICGDNTAVGIGIILDGPTEPPGGVVLQESSGKTHSVTTSLTHAESRFGLLNGNPNVLQAFLATLSD